MKNSSFFPEKMKLGPQSWLPALMLLIIAGSVSSLYALDPNRALSQYPHDIWNSERGLPDETVYALAQTPDGYLWLGTEKGLVQFDGINFRLIEHSDNASLPSGRILGLLTDATGSLWIRFQGTDIIRYRNGKFENILAGLQIREIRVTSMSLGHDGNILLYTLSNGILRYDGERLIEFFSKDALPNSMVVSMTETAPGELWLGTRDVGLNRINGKDILHLGEKLPDQKINCLLPDEKQEVLIGTDKGLARWNGTELTKEGIPAALSGVQILTMFKDRDSNIWIGTGTMGILRLNKDGLATTGKNMSSATNTAITALFEDREGNLWAGSNQGLERFRDAAFTTYSSNEGLPSEKNGAIFIDSENSLWFAPLAGGLYRFRNNRSESITVEGLDKDIIYSITGNQDGLWIGRQRGGLTHLYLNKSNITAQTFTEKEGLAQNSVYTVYVARDGSVWAGTLSGGVSCLKKGEIKTFTTAASAGSLLASNTITGITEGPDGTMCFASPEGLTKFSPVTGQWTIERGGLPSENIGSILEDPAGILWLGTAKGLAYRDGAGQIHSFGREAALLQETVLGLAEDKTGALWISTPNHILQAGRSRLLDGSINDADIRVYDLADGLKSTEGVKRSQSVIADERGRIWLSLSRGISMIDISRYQNRSVPALVQIQTISVDGTVISAADAKTIPPARQRLIFNYTGLSLSIPERVSYRYYLEGFDHDWSAPTNAREAVYTNLGPGEYYFHVKSSNSDGVWNSGESIIKFEIEPAFWQTWWFRFLCVLFAVLIIILLYRVRLYRVTRQLNLRFEERLAERTRIAQELHDSLLQGVVSASIQLNVATDNLPDQSPVKPQLDRIVQLMADVLKEGRNTLRGLRQPDGDSADKLEDALAAVRRDLGVADPADFRVIVEGSPHPVRALVQEEIYNICREALLNAFRHSNADKIEVVVEYGARHLRILVRDDGIGIAQQTIDAGREGHWGLIGMRERAGKIDARLKVWSRTGAGTEIELIVPNKLAYQRPSSAARGGRFSKFWRRKPKTSALEKGDN